MIKDEFTYEVSQKIETYFRKSSWDWINSKGMSRKFVEFDAFSKIILKNSLETFENN